MAAGTVGQYSIGAFSSPGNGDDLDASVVQGNDNTIASTYNEHDADPTIHIQSSTLALRPAAGTAQRVWVTTDGYKIYIDTGVAWQELRYISLSSGGLLTQDLLFTDATYDIGKVGATRPRDGYFSRNFSIGGTLGVTGTSTFTGTVHASNALTVDGTATLATAVVTAYGNGIHFDSDNSYDIGSSGTTRPRGIFVGTAGITSAGSLSGTAGDFSGDVDIGGDLDISGTSSAASYGSGSAPSTGGGFRLSNNSALSARNNANTGNVTLIYLAVSDHITIGGSNQTDLASSNTVFLGNALFNADNTKDIGSSGALRPRAIYVGTGGLDVAGGTVNLATSGTVKLSGVAGRILFFGTGTAQQKAEVTGSRDDNPALTNLLDKLHNYGLITNSTS